MDAKNFKYVVTRHVSKQLNILIRLSILWI
jgi:hypothetical protein